MFEELGLVPLRDRNPDPLEPTSERLPFHQPQPVSQALDPDKEDAERIVTELFSFWMAKPDNLPSSYREKARQEPLPRVVCDYIAGMTDSFIYEQYQKYVA